MLHQDVFRLCNSLVIEASLGKECGVNVMIFFLGGVDLVMSKRFSKKTVVLWTGMVVTSVCFFPLE